MAAAPSSLVRTFGEPGESGTGPCVLSKPIAVAVSQEGEIFVANGMTDRIQRFTLQGGSTYDISTILDPPHVGYIPESINAHSVAIDKGGNAVVVGATADGHVYVAVYGKQQGILTNKFSLGHTGWRGVAVDHKNHNILIVKTTGSEPWNFHSEVQVFAPQSTGTMPLTLELEAGDGDNPQGEVLVFCSWPDVTFARTVGQQQGMKDARYITVDGEGNILVSDFENHCIYVYKEDGQFLFQFGGWGSGEGQLKHPCGICTDRAGNIIVADSGNNRVEMFDKTGRFIRHITTDMTRPCAVAMAPQGEVVVTDIQSNTITVFGAN